MRIGGKTLLSLGVVVSLAIVTGLGVYLFFSTQSSRADAHVIYDQIRRKISERILAGKQRLNEVVSDPNALADDPTRCTLPLKAAMLRYGGEHDVFLRIRADGYLDCTPKSGDVSVDLSGRLYFRNAVETGKPTIGEFLIGKVSQEPVLAVATPVHDRNGDLQFVFATGVKVASLRETLEDAVKETGLAVEISDADGVPLSYFDTSGPQNVFKSDGFVELVRLPLIDGHDNIQILILEKSRY